MDRLKGKVALVVGSTSGIGEGIARRFAKEGAKVVISGRRDELGKAIAADICAQGGEACFIKADATIESDVIALTNAVVEKYGKLDIGVNALGGNRGKLFKDMTAENWDYVIKLNLYSVFYCIKYESEKMREQGGGVIISISSLNSTVPNDYQVAYCAAKAGVDMMTKVAALEMGPEHIRLCTINPGLIATPLTKKFTDVPEIYEEFLYKTPLRKIGTVDDIANAALFLASDEASHITATSLLVDGGEEPEGYCEAFKILNGTYKR
jgi:NAD(P)-dependent dehydrogenase (short-subunit alcohol dehydrogenase family)